jgi:sulfate-transporting ATPase
MSDDKKIIFSMVGVSKTFPPHKQVLKDIYLSFYYGAKIGIIGLNGSGKSTLLKIIAGIEKEYQGEVVSDKSFSVGYLEQDPHLDPGKTVIEVVREGVQPVMDLLAEYEEINMKFGLPEYYENEDKMNALFERQGVLQDKLDAVDAWNIDNRLERAMDALRCPPEEQSVTELSAGREDELLCVGCYYKNLMCFCWMNLPTIWMRSLLIGLSNICNNIKARLSVLHTTATFWTMWQVGYWNLTEAKVFLGKVTTLHGLNKRPREWNRKKKQASKRRKTLERELEWINMAPKARHAKGKARLNSYEQLLNQDQKEREEKLEIFIPNGPRLGNKVIEAHSVSKAYGDKLFV